MEKTYDLFINGKWKKPKKYLKVFLPYDGSLVGEAPDASLEEVEEAIKVASKAKKFARKLSPYKRYEILSKASEIMKKRKEEITKLISLETGKPIKEAEVEVERAIQTIIFSSEEAKRIYDEVIPLDSHPFGSGRIGLTIREPKGVILAITPFNAPFNLACHKVGPALASGNTVVLKPSSLTPLTAYLLADILREAELPDGFFNVISGRSSNIGDFLVAHPEINMVSFTGSLEVGKRIRNIAGLKTVTLELGSNSSVIIEPDIEIKNVLQGFISSAFSNSGQVCISLQRAYVHENIFNSFIEILREEVSKIKIGHPLDKETQISSLISPDAAKRVFSWIEEAIIQGAEKLVGGEIIGRATITPTILSKTNFRMKVVCEEIFGPVVVIEPYKNLMEAITYVNNSKYGLQTGIFTSNIFNAFYAAKEIESGGVIINDFPSFRVDQMPYGGIKESGLGREGPKFAIEEMTERKLIVIKNG